MADRLPREANFIPVTGGVDSTDPNLIEPIAINPATQRLLVETQGGAGGTSSVDDAAFTAGTDSGTPAMGFFSTDTVDSGDVGVLAMDASRRLFVSLEVDNVGLATATNQTDVIATLGTTTYTEASTKGNVIGVVRNDTLAALADADNEIAPLQVDSTGALYTILAEGSTKAQVFSPTVDAQANSNGLIVHDQGYYFNGSTWDRVRGDLTDGLLVNLGANNDVTATLDAETTKVIGTVNIAAAQTIAVTNAGTFATQATLQTGSNAIGKLAANSGVDIGDVDVTSTSIDGSINGPGAPTIDSVTQFAINLAAGANQVLVASAADKQIWVYAVAYTLSVAGTVSFQDEDDVAITGIMDHAANSGMGVGPSGNFAMPLWKLATNKDLEVDVVTAAMDGWITYSLVSV